MKSKEAPQGKKKMKMMKKMSYATGEAPRSLVLADFNGDGILDLATANAASHDVSILLGNGVAGRGDGTFAPATTYVFQDCRHFCLSAGDFDADGDIDLASVCSGAAEEELSIHLNDGTAGFTKLASYDVPGIVGKIITADFTGDGILDIVAVDSYKDTVVLYPGNGSGGKGDGTFAHFQRFPAGGWSESLAAADLNNDGLLDLLLANVQPGNLAVLLGAGECR